MSGRPVRGAAAKRWELKEPAEQILDLADGDVLDTMVCSWARDALYEEMIDDFKLAQLRRVLPKMGLQVAEGHGAIERMRAAAKAAVKAHAEQHPELLQESAAEAVAVSAEEEEESKSQAAAERQAEADAPAPSALESPPRRGSAPRRALQPSLLAALGSLPRVPAAAATGHAPRRRRVPPVEPGDDDEDSAGPCTPPRRRHPQRRLRSDSPPSSSSSSSSSPSDGSSPERDGAARSHGRLRGADLDAALSAAGASEPIAKEYIRNAGGKGNLYRVFKYDVHFDKERNHREALALARIIDAALLSGVRSSASCIELACRRLAGVHAADYSGGNWALCDELEGYKEKQSFLPARVLQRTVKHVARLDALKKSGSHATLTTGAGKSGRGRAASGQSRSRESGEAHSGASSAAPRKGAAAGGSGKQ